MSIPFSEGPPGVDSLVRQVLGLLMACVPAVSLAQRAPPNASPLAVASSRPALKVLSVTQAHPGDVDVVMQFDRQPFPLARQLQMRLASGATVAADRVDELPSSGALMVCINNAASVEWRTLELVKSTLSRVLVPPAGYSRLGAQVSLGDASGRDMLNGFVDDAGAIGAAISWMHRPVGRLWPIACASWALKRSRGMEFSSRTLLMLASGGSVVDPVERDLLLADMKATPDLTVTVVNISGITSNADSLSALYEFGKATPTSTYMNPQGAEGLLAVLENQVARASPGPSVRAHFTYAAVDDPGKATTATVRFQDAPDSGLSATLPVPLLSSK